MSPKDYNFAEMYGNPDSPESRAQAHYLELQLAGNAPRTLAEHEQYQRWRAHDPAIIALRARLEEATRLLTLIEIGGAFSRATARLRT